MECPVCYTDKCDCKLACGHSFCKSCVKDWYIKAEAEPSCPMCRSTLYFRGMHKVVDKWEQEFEEKKWDDIYSEVLTEVLEDFEEGDATILQIEDMENAYRNIRELHDAGYDFSWDFIRDVLRHPYFFSDLHAQPDRKEYWDDNTLQARKTIFVSRYPQWRGLRI